MSNWVSFPRSSSARWRSTTRRARRWFRPWRSASRPMPRRASITGWTHWRGCANRTGRASRSMRVASASSCSAARDATRRAIDGLTGMRITGALLIIGALLAATVADDSWAGRGGGGRGGFGGRSAAAGASRSGGWHGPGHMHFPHHSHGSVFFVGGSYWGYPYYWSPYYSAPYAVVVPYQDSDV